MILLQGTGVSGGAESGTLYFYRRQNTAVSKKTGCDPAEQQKRLNAALAASAAQLEELAVHCRRDMGEEAAVLFETHALLTEDEDFLDCIHRILAGEGCNAEYAVFQAGEEFSAMFAAMEDSYMNARAADVRDVAGRILRNLMGLPAEMSAALPAGKPVILAADDLAPSETIRLDRNGILGFVMQQGSGSSHTAILARTMGIPAICGLGGSLTETYHGRTVCMDGDTGELIIDPDGSTLARFREKMDRQQEVRGLLGTVRGKEDVTPDGQHIHVYCNIGSPADIPAVLANDGRGIGLFRSEFLYLASRDYPTEDEQFSAYREVAAAMEGKRVIIRTLDIGADKQAEYFRLEKEENPAMGLRAIRLCLNRPEIFRTQLRALYRASAFGKISIMFPMITAVWEVQKCLDTCRSVMQELTEEKIPFDPAAEIGIMIETPAAVLIAEELAQMVDFFSVGTNDLSQYILACDRQAGSLGRFFDPHHPAILRALRLSADAAHRHGIWIGVCGELASDPAMLPFFLSLGIDELSVSPPCVLPLRAAIRQSSAGKV